MFSLLFLRHAPRGAVLAIIDGFGESAWKEGNGIQKAKTPTLDYLKSNFIYTSLVAAQQPVGLIRGEPGSSSVGHQTLGLGRTTPSYYQQLERGMNENSTNFIGRNEILIETIQHAVKNNGRVHFAGLCTDTGVFSHIKFLKPLFDAVEENNGTEIIMHCFFTHTAPKPSNYLKRIEEMFPKNVKGRFGTISSCITALDKFKNWHLSNKTAQAIIQGKADVIQSKEKLFSLLDSYREKFIDYDPLILSPQDENHLKEGDSIIFFNHREEQSYQVAKLVIEGENTPQNIKATPMILYDPSLSKYTPILPSITYNNSIGSVISQKGFKQIRIAEEYKKFHITKFLSGGITQPLFPLETDVIDFTSVPEAIVENFPYMNASRVYDAVEEAIISEEYKFIAVNFANIDATGHSGNTTAVTLATEYIDKLMQKIVNHCDKHDYALFITADHGNGEEDLKLDGARQVDHTVNNVPFITTAKGMRLKQMTIGQVPYIGNVAPTILKVLGIEIPQEMDEPILEECDEFETKSIRITDGLSVVEFISGFFMGISSLLLFFCFLQLLGFKIAFYKRGFSEPKLL